MKFNLIVFSLFLLSAVANADRAIKIASCVELDNNARVEVFQAGGPSGALSINYTPVGQATIPMTVNDYHFSPDKSALFIRASFVIAIIIPKGDQTTSGKIGAPGGSVSPLSCNADWSN